MLDNAKARRSVAGLVEPIARGLLRIGLTPDAVTWIGCIASVSASVFFIAKGEFVQGALLLGIFTLTDLFDGTMARLKGTAGPWGSFLDSTLDRISDAALFISLAYFYGFVSPEVNQWAAVSAVLALTAAFLTSYARAKAESLNATCTVGIAERAERTLLVWFGLMFSGIVFDVMPQVLFTLVVLSTITVAQRMLFVRKQLAA